MANTTAHNVAYSLIKQLAVDQELLRVSTELFGMEPQFCLDDDVASDRPRIVCTPARESGILYSDTEMSIELMVAVPDPEIGSGMAQDYLASGDVSVAIPSFNFDTFADAVWQAVRRASPGAKLVGREAEWDYVTFKPLRIVVFTLNYNITNVFGD